MLNNALQLHVYGENARLIYFILFSKLGGLWETEIQARVKAKDDKPTEENSEELNGIVKFILLSADSLM